MNFDIALLKNVKPMDLRSAKVDEWYRATMETVRNLYGDNWPYKQIWFYKSSQRRTHLVIVEYDFLDIKSPVKYTDYRWDATKQEWCLSCTMQEGLDDFYTCSWYKGRKNKNFVETATYKKFVKTKPSAKDYLFSLCGFIYQRIYEYSNILFKLSQTSTRYIATFATDLIKDFGEDAAYMSLCILGVLVVQRASAFGIAAPVAKFTLDLIKQYVSCNATAKYKNVVKDFINAAPMDVYPYNAWVTNEMDALVITKLVQYLLE